MDAQNLNLIMSGFAAVGGISGIVALIRTLATVKNEKDAGQIANETSALNSLKVAIDGFEDVITDLKNERNEARLEARQYRDDKEAYRQACITAEGGFCTNYGCPLRNPARGLGAQWLRENAGSEALAGNYKNLPELMAEKGIKAE